MSITANDVKHIARLARLGVSEEEIAHLTQDLDRILKMVAEMDSLDVSDVAPMAHPADHKQPLREDIVTEQNQRDILMSQAPLTEAGLFLVPKVIE